MGKPGFPIPRQPVVNPALPFYGQKRGRSGFS